jgi:hypothetical protein
MTFLAWAVLLLSAAAGASWQLGELGRISVFEWMIAALAFSSILLLPVFGLIDFSSRGST